MLAATVPLSDSFRSRSGMGDGHFAVLWGRGIVGIAGIGFIVVGILGIAANA